MRVIILLLILSFPIFARPCNCNGYAGPGGPCYAGPGGPCYAGPGGPYYTPGGCNAGPGGPCYAGPGGPYYAGPGGPLYSGTGNTAKPSTPAPSQPSTREREKESSKSDASSGADVGFLVTNYQQRAKAVEVHLDNYRNAVRKGESKREIERLRDNFISSQEGLKKLREDSNKKGANISPDYYETVKP